MEELMQRRLVQSLAASVLLAGATWPALPAAAARPTTMRDILSGVWRVERRCISGCNRSQVVIITVSAIGHGTYTGAGSQSLMLYPVSSTQVIVHARLASSLLTVKSPGKTMDGAGIGLKGETFVSTWQCVSAHCGS
jgi:hypothetical protein